MGLRPCLPIVVLFLGLAPLQGGDVQQARRAAESQPSAEGWIGLSEVQRASGDGQRALQTLLRAADTTESLPMAAAIHDLLCWQMLPAGQASVLELRRQVERLRRAGGKNTWLPVHELHLALLEQDRAALLAAAGDLTLPTAYPTVLAEQCHLRLLRAMGAPRVQAGLEVIGHRSPDTLHALRVLDRGLTREAAFLHSAGRDADARRLERTRDRLRQAYLEASRHAVERLFALNLLGRTKERDALLAKVQEVPYLTDRQRLGALILRLDETQTWERVLQPLLASEVQLLETPPDLDRLRLQQSELQIEARTRSEQGGVVCYEGAVRVRLGNLDIACDRLTVIRAPNQAGTTLAGSGAVTAAGVVWRIAGLDEVRADRFTFNSDASAFTFGGDVRLRQRAGPARLRSCTVTAAGELRDPRSLLDDFRATPDTASKLALLPAISRVYTDEELPGDVRYLLALRMLRPHLTWHAPYVPPRFRGERLEELREARQAPVPSDRWQEALGGEGWLLEDVPARVREDFNRAAGRIEQEARPNEPRVPLPKQFFFWRIKDPAHADIVRALALLDGVGGDLGHNARRWAAEVRRNNTILTFDITGGYARGKDARLIMDARNADQVMFKLYRVHRPEDLLWVADRIGDDFLYRDYGLQHGGEAVRLAERKQRALRDSIGRDVSKTAQLQKPEFHSSDLVRQWSIRPDELRALDLRGDQLLDDGDDHDDARYFDDACERFRARIEKRYRPRERQLSSWRCDRVVEVPGQALREAGAYVLIAEANGQTACVPLLVDPLSLTLGRCRDGVFAMVSDHEGKEPVAGAAILGKGMLGEAVTDREGAAFVRLFAAGERAILAHKDGRFAIGGFGRLFEGIYRSPWDHDRRWRDRLLRAQEVERLREPLAHVYSDRHLVAACTDRPTYRPGQEVQFKLIVRRLVPEQRVGAASSTFRAADFDARLQTALPPEGTSLRYAALDPRGRAVAEGELVLNDHGTAAGRLMLNAETATGAYALRVGVGGMDRIVPDVFGVQYYRRPTFELQITGLPAKLKKPRELNLELTGRYYFGKPVAGGRATVRLVQADAWKPLVTGEETLDDAGRASLKLELPERMDPGQYHLVGVLIDDSGRTVSRSLSLEIVGPPAAEGRKGLAALPRFVPHDRPLAVSTTAAEVVAEQADQERLTFPTKDGTATIRLPRPGWYTLRAGGQEVDLFAYGGKLHPLHTSVPERPQSDDQEEPRWVDLSDYHAQEDGRTGRWERDGQQLLALFDRQHVRVGDRLRVLVYSPYQRARLLFTIEGRTIVDYVVAWTPAADGCYHVIEIPIKERYLPNFYLQGRILYGQRGEHELVKEAVSHAKEARAQRDSDESQDPRWCRIDVLDPNRKPGEEKLRVEVEPRLKEYRPGETVHVQLRVTDRDGKPRMAEVSLAAVDESVFTFGEDNVGSLARFFGDGLVPQRFMPKAWRSSQGDRWDVKAHAVQRQQEALKQLAQAMQQAKSGDAVERPQEPTLQREERPDVPPSALGGQLPAASLALARLRTDFRETAAWQPQLRTGPDGRVQTSFKLPDSLTQYRLTAVALTRETEIGVGRSSLRVTQPLAVQLILPRFAVEKDRLLAVGLLHNNSDRERVCWVSWTIDGARIDGLPVATEEWTPATAEGRSLGRGRVALAPRATARIGVWLALEHAGTVKVSLRVADDQDADAEARTLPVQLLGRPREVAHNDVLPEAAGKAGFNREKRLVLPAGFVTQDLHISLSCVDAAHALEGLGYLIDYPYGCVEQTMSRFLPAVMVKHASQRAPVSLPPEVAARLPEVLDRGLARLYHFQHADGGWGWWERDASNVPMSIYVVYGLARCQTTGTTVDRSVLDRGCDFLKMSLRGGRLDADTSVRAWLALALAGRAEVIDLQALAQRTLQQEQASPEVRAHLALACRWLGLNEEGERLWAAIRTWQPEGTERTALKLNAQIAFGAPFEDCRQSARRLLALRTGERWNHTRDASWAIEALANMLPYVPDRTPVRRVRVTVGGRAVLDVAAPEELEKLAYRVHLSGERLPAQEALEIVLWADCDEPMRYVVRAAGTQRLDRLEPEGKQIQLRRRLETLDGQPVVGPLTVGQVVAVRLELNLERNADYVIIEDRRPAGCEYSDDRILPSPPRERGTGAEGAGLLPSPPLRGRGAGGEGVLMPAHVEFRDDRLCIFHTALPAGRHEIVYYLRAETPGVSHILPGCAYPMYAEQIRGETGSARLEIKGP